MCMCVPKSDRSAGLFILSQLCLVSSFLLNPLFLLSLVFLWLLSLINGSGVFFVFVSFFAYSSSPSQPVKRSDQMYKISL